MNLGREENAGPLTKFYSLSLLYPEASPSLSLDDWFLGSSTFYFLPLF